MGNIGDDFQHLLELPSQLCSCQNSSCEKDNGGKSGVVLLSSGGWQLRVLPVTLPNPAQFPVGGFRMGFQIFALFKMLTRQMMTVLGVPEYSLHFFFC